MKKKVTLRQGGSLLLALLVSFWIGQESHAQLLVDNFDRPNSNSIGNGWTESETNAPTSVKISSNALLLESNISGREYISKVTPGLYQTTLTNNACKLEWSFNMRQNALNPNGMTAANHGVAMVLAGSNGNLLQGQGYAVVLGTSGTTVDPLRLVRYSNGLTHNNVLTSLISVGDFNNQSLSIRVTYDPVLEEWEMFYSAGASFSDPQVVNTSAGTATDSFYTGVALPYIGCIWNHGIVNSTRAHFDNIHVPYDCASRIEFSAASGSVNSLAGTVQIPLTLENPHFTNDAQITVDLTSGDASIVDGAITSNVIIPGGTTSGMLQLNIPVNGECKGDQQLMFTITNITGGSGTPTIGLVSKYLLTVEDDMSTGVSVLNEGFETDGLDTRYTLNASSASPGSGSYFFRGQNAAFSGASGMSISGTEGSYCMGAAGLGGIATNAEVVLMFEDLDILGMSELNIGLLAGARYATNYDQAAAQRDHLMIEVNVDGAGWITAGAFRSHKENPFVDGWFALDTDLDGVGDGVRLNATLSPFNFPIALEGENMDLRIRMRSTAAGEDIFFDHVQVNGTLCTPIYFSAGSGIETDAIWSHTRTGSALAASMDKNGTFIIQNGHSITAGGSARELKELTVESGAALHLQGADWSVIGNAITNDGSIDATLGMLRLISEEAATISGTGTFDLYNLRLRTPAGTTASSNISIKGTLSLEEGVLDAQASTVRLISSASGTGRLGRVGVGADYIGDLTIQRYIPAGTTNWRFLGSPVAGAAVQHWQDDFYTAGYPGSNYPNFYSPPGSGIHWPSVRWYDETDPGANENDGLTGVTSTMPLAQGQGFAAWCGTNFTTTNAFIIDMTGAPHIAHSPITLPMSYTNTGNPIADGYNLVSNPLPSPILFSELVRGADVSAAYWIYDPQTGSNASWNGVVGTNGANGIIQSSQAFWLKANGPAVTTTIAENAKVNNNTGGVFGDQTNNMAMMRLKVNDANMEFGDETLIVFSQGVPQLDEQDVVKMAFSHPAAPTIASQIAGGTPLSINMYGMPATAVTIPVDVEVPVTGTYSIKATDIEIIAGLTCVQLKDLLTGEEYQLTEGSEYEFVIEAGENATPRFEVRMATPIQRELTHVSCNGLTDGAITISVLDGPAEVTLMDVFSGVIDQATGYIVTFDSLAAGDYMIGLTDYEGCGEVIGAIEIFEPLPIEADLNSTNAACGGTNGSIVSQVFGGTQPYTYTWNNGNSGNELTAGPGEYVLSVTDANGCQLESEPALIQEDPAPVAMFEPADEQVYQGQALSFLNFSTNAEQYEWNMGDGTIINSPEVTYMFGIAGVQTISLTAIKGACSHTTSQDIMVIGATGINEITGQDIHVWHDGTNINVRHEMESGPITIELLDATGRLHAQATAPGVSATVAIPAADLNAGVWFIRISNSNEQFSSRVVITR